MQLDTLQWPGLWDLPICIVDYDTNKIYDKDHPLPPQKSHLDSVKNRCVRLSAVLELFSEEMRKEAEWTLRQLQSSYDIGKAIHSTAPAPKSASENGETGRKLATYIPSVALMAFAVIWPFCQGFQVRQTVFFCRQNLFGVVCKIHSFINFKKLSERVLTKSALVPVVFSQFTELSFVSCTGCRPF